MRILRQEGIAKAVRDFARSVLFSDTIESCIRLEGGALWQIQTIKDQSVGQTYSSNSAELQVPARVLAQEAHQVRALVGPRAARAVVDLAEEAVR